MVDYVELLVGEALLGDLTNTYLYIGEDLEAQQIAQGAFVRRVREEQQVSSVTSSVGRVVVNETQRFLFAHKTRYHCISKGTSFNRIFVDVSDPIIREDVMCSLMPNLISKHGDFV